MKNKIGHHVSNFKFQISTRPASTRFNGLFSSFPDISNFNFQISILLTLTLLASCNRPVERGANVMPLSNPHELMLSESQMKLGNITTQTVSVKPIGQTLVLNARLTASEDLTAVVSSRVAGRIEKLFIKETGRVVRSGEPLYELYSEMLLTLQREYLLAREQFESLGSNEPRYESFLKASERKLLLYGLTKKQVGELSASRTIKQRITFLAPSDGMVSEVKTTEGQYVEEGTLLYRIENVSRLWLEAELYPGESGLVRQGDQITVRISGFESTPLEAKVIFLSPEYTSNSQVTLIRALIENQDGKFKPGMQAQVLLSHSSKRAVAVPTDAVIRDGKGTHVYIETGTNTFRPRLVRTGLEDFEQVEITEGLMEGDRIAVTGAYLLYSENILKGGTELSTDHRH
jgi:Cu(I)/Ag(I) efflux system membrane fusion protein